MIEAVLFDLDDTLYLQEEWLTGAFDSVAAEAERTAGADRLRLRAALSSIAAEGSDKGRIIDRALAQCGHDLGSLPQLVRVFLAHAPAQLTPLPGVTAGLAELRRHVPLGLVTDGDPDAQKAKLRALGLAGAFDAVVISDELGRDRRKPDPSSLLAAASLLGVDPAAAVYVGDRPGKDVAAAQRAGMKAVRVGTGEHAAAADDPQAWLIVADADEAIRELLSLMLPAPSPRAGGR